MICWVAGAPFLYRSRFFSIAHYCAYVKESKGIYWFLPAKTPLTGHDHTISWLVGHHPGSEPFVRGDLNHPVWTAVLSFKLLSWGVEISECQPRKSLTHLLQKGAHTNQFKTRAVVAHDLPIAHRIKVQVAPLDHVRRMVV